MTEIFEPQYLVQKKRQVFSVGQSAIKKENENLRIVKGKFKSDRLFTRNEYEFVSPHLSIVLTTNGRKIMSSTYNVGTSDEPRFITRKITPNDVFYDDIKIVDAYLQTSIVQVKKINNDNTFDAVTITGEEVPNVPFKDVVSLEPGFKWKYSDQTTTEESEQSEQKELIPDETVEVEETDEIEDPDSKEDGYEDEVEEVLENEPEMKETFNDKDRLNQEETKLTSAQLTYKNSIENILKFSGISIDSINIYAVAELLDEFFELLVKKNNNDLLTKDIKYITAAIVFCELITSQYRQDNRNFGYASFTAKLIKSKFLKEADVDGDNTNEYLLLNQKMDSQLKIMSHEDFVSQHNTIERLRDQNKFEDIIYLVMRNALDLAKSLLGRVIVEEPGSFSLDALIPIGRHNPDGKKTLTHEYSFDNKGNKYTIQHYANESPENPDMIKMITMDDFLQNKRIPQKETKILWGADAQILIQQTKNDVQNLADAQDDPETKKGYEYIVKNIERGPYAIREETNPFLRKYFKFIFGELVKTVIKQKSRKQKVLQKNKRKADTERAEFNERRNKIMKNKMDEMDVDEVPIKNTSSYEKESRLREMKKVIAKGKRTKTKTTETKPEEPETEETEETEETDEQKSWRLLSEDMDTN